MTITQPRGKFFPLNNYYFKFYSKNKHRIARIIFRTPEKICGYKDIRCAFFQSTFKDDQTFSWNTLYPRTLGKEPDWDE